MDVEAVLERGRAMGLRDRRHSVSVGSRTTRRWRWIPACLVAKGDTWVDHGKVLTVETGASTRIVAGADRAAYDLENEKVIKVFTEVDVRYGKIDGKGIVHITATSMDRDSFASTLCGKSGAIQLVPDDQVKRVCSPCTKASEGQ